MKTLGISVSLSMTMLARSSAGLVTIALFVGLLSPIAAAALCDGISPASATPLTTVRITTGLVKPLYVTSAPGDTHRIFVLEQDGRIRIVKDGALLATSFLDVDAITQSSGNEEGLLGLAFSPDYATDGFFFIYHTDNGGGSQSIARYRVSGDPDLADVASRRLVLSIPHPTNSNHNGGNLQFGPDGMLYIGPGDGGSFCDPPNNAQNTSELKGKMLRINVIPGPGDPGPYYAVPADNPGFPRPEIWSIGLRNPWRYSFDRLTGDLYIGDVGQDVWEEIDYRPYPGLGKGENYGWDHYEACACPNTSCGGVCSPLSPRVDPVKIYSLAGTPCAVTGGYVYRGCRMPTLSSLGRYFYADYCAATINSFIVAPGGACGSSVTSEVSYTAQLSPSIGGFTIGLITSFGEDAQGEIHITDRGSVGPPPTGEVFKIVPVLRSLEVSGRGAAPLLLTPASFTWEDLALTSSHPIDHYRVYRNDGNGSGTFTCIFKTAPVTPPTRPPTTWAGGDPADPAPDAVYSYLVTAVRNTPLEETSPGTTSAGSPRTLSATACP